VTEYKLGLADGTLTVESGPWAAVVLLGNAERLLLEAGGRWSESDGETVVDRVDGALVRALATLISETGEADPVASTIAHFLRSRVIEQGPDLAHHVTVGLGYTLAILPGGGKPPYIFEGAGHPEPEAPEVYAACATDEPVILIGERLVERLPTVHHIPR
jgi:hypothetical protein